MNASASGTYTVTYTVAAAPGCSVYSNSTNVTISVPGSWIGAISNKWSDPANWLCGQVPTKSINVIVLAGAMNYPVVSGTGMADNITIQSGASLTILGGTLQVFGAINNSGQFDVTNGTIEMKGTNAQTISGNGFYKNTIKNLIVSNTGAGVLVSPAANDTLKIAGTLSFGNSTSKINTGDNITLLSSDTATAAVGVVGPDNAVLGKVVVERYVNT